MGHGGSLNSQCLWSLYFSCPSVRLFEHFHLHFWKCTRYNQIFQWTNSLLDQVLQSLDYFLFKIFSASYTSRSTTTPYSLPSSSPEIFKPRPTPSLQDDSRVDMSSNRRSPLHNFRRTPSCSSYDLHDLGETEVHRLNNNGHRRKSKRLLTCSECNYVSDRKNNLVRHIASMHTAKNERSFYCCDQFFATKCEQQRHKKLHHKNGFQCRLCGNKFARKPLLDRHLKGHHGELDVMKLQCQHCEYRTGSRAKMEHHMSTLHRTLSHATEIHL